MLVLLVAAAKMVAVKQAHLLTQPTCHASPSALFVPTASTFIEVDFLKNFEEFTFLRYLWSNSILSAWGLYYNTFYGIICCRIIIRYSAFHYHSLPAITLYLQARMEPTRLEPVTGLHSIVC
jgi:hypothetical protein